MTIFSPGQNRCQVRLGGKFRIADFWRYAGFCLLTLVLIAISPSSSALVFEPTEAEWLSWPDYCRARYTVSGAGTTSKFQSRISNSEVSRQESRIGAKAWVYLHHYCAGIVYLQRANSTSDKVRSEFLLNEAQRELMSQYVLLDKTDPLFVEVTASVAKLHTMRGEFETALTYLDVAIESQPKAPAPYAHSALVYKKQGATEKGLDVLLRGHAATDGTSAELNYFLGLFYVDLDDLDSASVHAKRAYALGYPLPGLASKLRKRGRSLN